MLDYADFAPQAACYALIGFEWNQWKSEGHPEVDDVPVRVVVYRGTSLGEVKKAYPVARGKSDYRYVRRDRALKFIEARLREWQATSKDERAGEDEMIARYLRTKHRIETFDAAR